MRRSRIAAFVAVLALPGSAWAQGLVARLPGVGPTAFTITDTTLLRFRGSNFDTNPHDDDFFSLTERIDIAATAAPWRLSLRLDGFSPWNHDTTCTPDQAASCYLHSDYRPGTYDGAETYLPERISLRWQRRGITLEGGDFYQVFGRAMTLAFRKVDPIGLDNALRGGRFEIDRDRYTVRGFAGLANPQNLDPISLAVFNDPGDFLTGASLAARVGPDEDVELSAHAVHTNFAWVPDAQRQDAVDVAGFRVDVPSLLDGDLSMYGEANFLTRTSHTGQATADGVARHSLTTQGRAVYAAAQVVRGRFTFLAEWKDYTHYLLAPTESANAAPQDVARIYSQAPTLERDDQRIFTNANVRGARLRIDYTVAPSPWIFTLNSVAYGWAESYDSLGNALDPWDATHGMMTSHTYFMVRHRARTTSRPTASTDAAAGGRGSSGAGTASASATGAVAPAAAGIGGVQVTRVSRGDYNLTASIGYRREFHTGTEQVAPGETPNWRAGDIKHESIQADVDLAFAVGAHDSLEVRVDNRIERNYTLDRLTGSLFDLPQTAVGMRGGVALSWSHGLPLVVSGVLRWDNTSTLRTFDALPFGMRNAGGNPVTPVLFPSAEVRWNFTANNFVRLFGGMTPGGRVCSGGVCRDVPLFQGAIAELVLRL